MQLLSVRRQLRFWVECRTSDPLKKTWIVDPIDGTQNFCSNLPLSCVSIGLAVGGKSELGVVYDPYRDELFVGVASEGKAFVSGERLHHCDETGARPLCTIRR